MAVRNVGGRIVDSLDEFLKELDSAVKMRRPKRRHQDHVVVSGRTDFVSNNSGSQSYQFEASFLKRDEDRVFFRCTALHHTDEGEFNTAKYTNNYLTEIKDTYNKMNPYVDSFVNEGRLVIESGMTALGHK